MEGEIEEVHEYMINEKTSKIAQNAGFKREDVQKPTILEEDRIEYWAPVSRDMVHKWLREKHGLYIHTYSLYPKNDRRVVWGFDVYDTTQGRNPDNAKYALFSCLNNVPGQTMVFETFEKMYEMAIRVACRILTKEQGGELDTEKSQS